MPPEDLLHLLKKLETDLGREGGKRWGPRVIDLDIVFYDCTILHTKDLVLPHRDMASVDSCSFPFFSWRRNGSTLYRASAYRK